jgi:myo-inositol catabolism protein IolC
MHDVSATQNMEQAVAYSRKVDRAYETQVCPQWWKGGPFQTWLAGYRAFLVADLPRQEDAEAKETAPLKLTGVKLEDYRSTLKMKAVKKYLLRIQDVYGGSGNLPDRFVNFYGRWEHPGQPPAR